MGNRHGSATSVSGALPAAACCFYTGIRLGDNGTYRCDLMGRHGTIDSVTHTLLVTGETSDAKLLVSVLDFFYFVSSSSLISYFYS